MIFSSSGYSSFAAFNELNLTDQMISSMKYRIRSLKAGDKTFHAFLTLTNKVPSEFVMLPGLRATLKRITTLIASLDEEDFKEKLIKTREAMTVSSTFTPRAGRMNTLDPNVDYSEIMKKSLVKVIKLVRPQIIEPKINLIEKKRTPKSIIFKVQCFFCTSETFTSVYVDITTAGNLRVNSSNFKSHVVKKHMEIANRLNGAKVILKSHFNL